MKVSDFYRELFIMLLCSITIRTLSKEMRTQIAVFDTGITINRETIPWLCQKGHYDATGTGIEDNDGHGTNIAGLVTKNLDVTKYCLIIIKYYDKADNQSIVAFKGALQHLAKLRPLYVNMSYAGYGYYDLEFNVINNLLARGSTVSVAAGNEKLNWRDVPCEIYPACYPFKSSRFYVVGAKDVELSNRNGPVNALQNGLQQSGFGYTFSGSSQACANNTNHLIRGIK